MVILITIHWKSTFDPIFQQHLLHGKKIASYMSPKIQNEIISLAGLGVCQRILENVRAARWFSLMADECSNTSANGHLCLTYRLAFLRICGFS